MTGSYTVHLMVRRPCDNGSRIHTYEVQARRVREARAARKKTLAARAAAQAIMEAGAGGDGGDGKELFSSQSTQPGKSKGEGG